MTGSITLQPEDIAEMIAQSIGDGMAWLIRWTLVLLFRFIEWTWGVALPTAWRGLAIVGLLVAFSVRLTVALTMNAYRWWKYRKLCRCVDQGGPFVTVDYQAVTI